MRLLIIVFLSFFIVLNSQAQVYSMAKADSLHLLGNVKNRAHQQEQAIEYYLEALKIKENLLDSTDSSIRKTTNNLADILMAKGAYWSSVKYRKRAIFIQQKNNGFQGFRLARYYNSEGALYFRLSLFDNALNDFKQSERLLLEIENKTIKDSLLLAGVWNNMGLYYLEIGDYQQAETYLRKTKTIWGEHNLTDQFSLLEYNFGDLYRLKHDYERALIHYKIAKEYFFQDTTGKGRLQYANCLERIGFTLVTIGENRDGLDYLLESIIAKEKHLPADHKAISDGYFNYGMSLRTVGYFSEANNYLEGYYQKVKRLKDSVSLGAALTELGNLYYDKGDFIKATPYYSQALVLKKKYLPSKSRKIGEAYLDLATTYLAQEKWALSVLLIDSALYQLDPSDHLENENFSAISSIYSVVEALEKRALSKSQHSLVTNNIKQAKEALSDFHKLRHLIAFIQLSHHNEDDKLLLLKKIRTSYEQALATICFLYQKEQSSKYIEDAFLFMEQSKSILLYEGWQKRKGSLNKLIDGGLLTREYTLKQKIQAVEEVINQSNEKEYLNALIKDKNQYLKAFYLLQDSIKNSSIKLYENMYTTEVVSVHQIQEELLEGNQSLISYFKGETNLFTLVVNKTSVALVQNDETSMLDSLMQVFHFGINAYFEVEDKDKTAQLSNETLMAYISSGQELFKTLIVPVQNELSPSLIIIPDVGLGQLSFEALLTDTITRPQSIQRYPFMLKKHQLSYGYSANLLWKNKKNPVQQISNDSILVMAPFNKESYSYSIIKSSYKKGSVTQNKQFSILNNSEILGIDILNKMEAILFLDSEATAEKFISLSPHFRYIHLATHAQATITKDNASFLAFAWPDKSKPPLLYHSAIYNLDLNAELVVLSACETGTGVVEDGEGVMSLARAFNFAGARNIISSLWLADNETAINLMTDFYGLLSTGKTSMDALYQSKLNYLEMEENRGEKSLPYFWANFVFYGNEITGD